MYGCIDRQAGLGFHGEEIGITSVTTTVFCPSRLRCPRLWLRTIAGKSTCGGSVAFPWEAHPTGGNYDGV